MLNHAQWTRFATTVIEYCWRACRQLAKACGTCYRKSWSNGVTGQGWRLDSGSRVSSTVMKGSYRTQVKLHRSIFRMRTEWV